MAPIQSNVTFLFGAVKDLSYRGEVVSTITIGFNFLIFYKKRTIFNNLKIDWQLKLK